MTSSSSQTVSLDFLRDVPLDNFPATLAGVVVDDVGLDGMTDAMLYLLGHDYTDPARDAATFAAHDRTAAATWAEQSRGAATWTQER